MPEETGEEVSLDPNTDEVVVGDQEPPSSSNPKDGELTTDDSEDKTPPSDEDSESDEKLFSFLAGMKEDLSVRLPLYRDDWGRPKNIFTVINATVFAFVIQLIPALIFAELMDRETQGNLATAETLLSSAIIGIIYAIFAGQPLV